jgi:hypothetical protein
MSHYVPIATFFAAHGLLKLIPSVAKSCSWLPSGVFVFSKDE